MQQGTDNLNTLTNIVYVLTDVLETNLMDMQEAFKKQGCALRHDVKRNYNTAIYAIRCIKRDIAHLESSTQENFGHDADITNALLLTLIDRCGDDDELAFRFYNYIKSFPSKLGLRLEVDDAFDFLNEKQKQ